jgi:hypothetical protein
VLSAPASVTLDAKDFLSDQTGISVTPTIAWSAPALGTADSYRVNLLNLGPPSTSILPRAWNFLTTETTLTVPPGVIQPGDQFIVTLAANATPGATTVTAPFRRGTEFSMVMVGSGLMTAAGSPSSPRRNGSAIPKGSTLLLNLAEDGRWKATVSQRNR